MKARVWNSNTDNITCNCIWNSLCYGGKLYSLHFESIMAWLESCTVYTL